MRLKMVTAALISAAAFVLPAKADILDPLHIECTGCIDNGANTPIPTGTSQFGFSSSPPGASGLMFLDILVPNNINLGTFIAPTTTLNGGGILQSALFSVNAWTSVIPTLQQYLGGQFASGSPANPFGAYSAGLALEPGANGFFDFRVAAGQVGPLNGPGGFGADVFTFSNLAANLPAGSYVLASLLASDGSVIMTANSGAGLVTQQLNPVPIPAVGTGLPGIFAFVLWMLHRNRKKREGLHLKDAVAAA